MNCFWRGVSINQIVKRCFHKSSFINFHLMRYTWTLCQRREACVNTLLFLFFLKLLSLWRCVWLDYIKRCPSCVHKIRQNARNHWLWPQKPAISTSLNNFWLSYTAVSLTKQVCITQSEPEKVKRTPIEAYFHKFVALMNSHESLKLTRRVITVGL